MARIEKNSTGIVGIIKHNIREFKDGICPTNSEVDPARIKDNYSIIRRGETAKDIEKYRKQIEKECFKFNRKNLVHSIEYVVTLPTDCPPEQERAFFEESYKYICSTLPMGDRAVFLAEVHCDEGKISVDGKTVVEGAKHLHVMAVPAVVDSKHEGYDFKLCADELTRRPILKSWHKNFQQWIDDSGVSATVASGVTSGKGISVKSLKEITKETGLTFDNIKELAKDNEQLKTQLNHYQEAVKNLTNKAADKDALVATINAEYQKLINHNEQLEEQLETKTKELEKAQDKIKELEAIERNPIEEEREWGSSSWGTSSWGTTKEVTYDK